MRGLLLCDVISVRLTFLGGDLDSQNTVELLVLKGERSLAILLVSFLVRVERHLPVVRRHHGIGAVALAADVADRDVDAVAIG